MRLPRPRLALLAAGAGLCLALAAIGAAAAQSLGPLVAAATAGDRFGILEWQLETGPNRLLAVAAELLGIGPEPDSAADIAAIRGYWADPSEAGENPAERAIERRLSRAISEAGLDSPLPLFGRQRIIWPPVDIELSAAPRILAVSPRGRIDYVFGRLLDPSLPRGRFAEIEAEIEAGGEWSAWIGGVGGVAFYPALVLPRSDPRATFQLAAHEWIHHYLAFHPLGLRYGASEELRTLNETVADIAGDELGAAAAGADFPERAANGADLDALYAQLRQLRLDAEALLADGEIEAAEALMERSRLDLAERGWEYRRINQAFFAFRGGYADRPDAVSPIGAELAALRRASPDLAAFMAVVRGFTGRDDLLVALG